MLLDWHGSNDKFLLHKMIENGIIEAKKTICNTKQLDITVKQQRANIVQGLLRRGLSPLVINPEKNVLLPPGKDNKKIDEYYVHLKKYSFRLFLRDIIHNKDAILLRKLQKYCSETTARRYLELLIHLGIIARKYEQTYFIVPEHIYSFGDTFEWFTAQVLMREFFCPAAWGIKIKETLSGGDYDVISFVERFLLYIETKSSPPKHVDSNEVSAFLDRIEDLRPDMAIFLEDTHLRMRDKIAEIFKQELRRKASRHKRKSLEVEQLEREIFTAGKNIFIINSKPDITANIGICISSFLKSKGIQLFAPRED